MTAPPAGPRPHQPPPTYSHMVLYDPEGLIEAQLPLDREPHESLVKAVLAWTDPDLAPRDYEQIALQLTGHAHAVAADVRRHAEQLPADSGRRAFAELILAEVGRQLSEPLQGTVRCAKDRARLVRALYQRLDRLEETAPAAAAPSRPHAPRPPGRSGGDGPDQDEGHGGDGDRYPEEQ